jgi:hypothetical protein
VEKPATAPPLPAADRHPVQIAEPVYLEGLKLPEGGELPVALHRMSAASEIQAANVKGATGLAGLLRFDAGRWEFQPLAVGVKGVPKATLVAGGSAFQSAGQKSDTLDLLQERASRLLRKKS